MILLLGDLHFVPRTAHRSDGVSVSGTDDETALVECVDHVSDRLTDVVLLGDLFDAYVEYRHLTPRGPIRLLGQLARLADAGITITYMVGNHDPWHGTFVEEELGFRLLRKPTTVTMAGVRLHLAHGDSPMGAGWVRRVVRHPLALTVYTTLLPGDSGQGLANWVSRRLARRPEDPTLPDQLTEYARNVLQMGGADVVAMGHSHVAALEHTPLGTYLNPGFWPRDRIIGIVDGPEADLQLWDGVTLRPVRATGDGSETPDSVTSLPESNRGLHG